MYNLAHCIAVVCVQIRFMQLTRMIERSFHADTEGECKEWIRCYRDVQVKLNEALTAASLVDRTRAMSFEDKYA